MMCLACDTITQGAEPCRCHPKKRKKWLSEKVDMGAYLFYEWDMATREWFVDCLQYVNNPFRYDFDGHTLNEDSRYSHLTP